MFKFRLLLTACALLLAFPALVSAQETITASPNPASFVDQITLTATGQGACPEFGEVTVAGTVITAEIRSSCPFTPPPPEPFSIETTVDPLDPGIYEVRLELPNGDLLATSELLVLDQEVCVPSATALCLNNGRFRVEADFETVDGDTGQAQTLELTDDSGLFYFFDVENVELIVKVLDACGTSFNAYWVFAAGLTNVEVELTVTDLMSGEVQTYENPLRTPFQPIQDTDAFATCP